METNETNQARLSGGEAEDRTEYLKLRALILQEKDVHECLELSVNPQEGRWLYLIKTPFASWPKYVVGWTDGDNEETEILFRCGMEANARLYYSDFNDGNHE